MGEKQEYGVLTKKQIEERLQSNSLIIRPLLDAENQINEIGIDFRLGYDFLVTIHGREAYLNSSLNRELGYPERGLGHHFQESRRQLGETFILHPNQTVLATSLEYIKLPNDIMMMLVMRSSYARLGITISTVVQPGYCGCMSLELTNNNSTPINLTVGVRLFQGIFMTTQTDTSYFNQSRKYACQVRPEPSAALKDKDLDILNKLWRSSNSI